MCATIEYGGSNIGNLSRSFSRGLLGTKQSGFDGVWVLGVRGDAKYIQYLLNKPIVEGREPVVSVNFPSRSYSFRVMAASAKPNRSASAAAIKLKALGGLDIIDNV